MSKTSVIFLSSFILLSLIVVAVPTRIAAADTTPPMVSHTIPVNGATDVPINSAISATFSEAMDPLTVTTATFALYQGVTPVAGVVSLIWVTATFTPNATLAASTAYTALITTGVKDLAGNAMVSSRMWTFTTGLVPDTTAPLVSSTFPANGLTGVPINSAISATFSEGMNPITLSPASFVLKQGGSGTPVPGAVTYAGFTVTFTPTSHLAGASSYIAEITTAVEDIAGNSLVSAKSWFFQTGSGPRAAVDLKSASNFAILAKSGISNTGSSTSIVGDIGVSPIAASAITGFALANATLNQYATSTLVNGKVFAADYAPPTPVAMTLSVSDMELAYLDAESRILPDYTELGGGNIGGLTLYPGLYKWTTNVNVGTDVVISGSATDVWIFQTSQDLFLSPYRKVLLTGGAMASNIFWQVAGQTTIGTSCVFNGNILCLTAIQLNTGATLNGRALAQTAVVLQNATIIIPAPAPQTPIIPVVTFPIWAAVVIVVGVVGLVSAVLLVQTKKSKAKKRSNN